MFNFCKIEKSKKTKTNVYSRGGTIVYPLKCNALKSKGDNMK